MTDINETLLNYYEEALDMGMNEDDAKEWAWDKLYGWREQMRMQELQDVLWGTYDDAIERGMSDKDAREWAVNLFVQVIGKDEYAYKPKKEVQI